jgi:hypothetical protein
VVLWTLGMVALAADPLVAVEILDPKGGVPLSDELPLPSTRTLLSPDGKYAVGVYVSAFQGSKAVVELVAGKSKEDVIKPKVRQSHEIDLWGSQTHTLLFKKQTWTLTATLGKVWDAPEPGPVDDPQRYVLVWDDAQLYPEAPVEKKKPPKGITRERELPGGRTDPLTQASPMRFIQEAAPGYLLVESVISPDRSHCQTGGPAIETTPLQHVVAAGDLVRQVTAREISAKLPDGTGYRIAAGVPAIRQEEGKFRITTGGLSLVIAATDEEIGLAYRPSQHFDTLREHPIALPVGSIGTTALGEVSWAGPDPLPVAGMRGVFAPRATVRVTCAEVRLAPTPGTFLPTEE